MKAPILFARPSILAAGIALLGTSLVVLPPITAQDETPSATPAPATAPPPAPPSDPTVSELPSTETIPSPRPTPKPTPTPTLADLTPPTPVKPSAAGGPATTVPAPPAATSGFARTVSPDGHVEFATGDLSPPTITTVRARLAPGTTTVSSADVKPDATTITVADLILTEEVNGNADEMARHYEAMVADYDSRRAGAAQAIFRLGENYRKAGRVDEARIQYARLLREFVDFPELATLSQRQLTQGLPRQIAGGGLTATPAVGPHTTASPTRDHAEWARAAANAAHEERSLLMEEIALLQSQVAQTQDLIASGQAPSTATMPLLREILQLKRQLVRTTVPEAAPKAESDDHSEGGGGATLGEGLFTPPAPEVPRAQEVPSR